jgi:hypothetical protein
MPQSAFVTGRLRDWFSRSEPPLRTALGLALGFHGLADEAVERIIVDEVGQSIRWAIISDGPVALVPDDPPFPQPDREPYIDSPVPDAIQVAERLRAGAEEQTIDFSPVHRLLLDLMEVGDRLIAKYERLSSRSRRTATNQNRPLDSRAEKPSIPPTIYRCEPLCLFSAADTDHSFWPRMSTGNSAR